MKAVLAQLRARPHLSASVAVGLVVVLATPGTLAGTVRLLIGWNTVVWLYLVQAAWVMSRADRHHVKRMAIAQAEGAGAVLATAIAAAVASMAAIALELAAAKSGSSHAGPHVAFAIFTVAGSWLLLPTLFALSYASVFYRAREGAGLLFPQHGDGEAVAPHYWDFLYFSFTIAVASQTADVAICNTAMRRLVLLQSVLSFVFNTAILALAVNIAAGLI
jgi:uncharacterized membrane protein